jgi:hypothetical protein
VAQNRDAVGALDLGGILFHRRLHGERRIAGAHGMIFMDDRDTEPHHHAIPQDLVRCALVPVYDVHHALQHRAELLPRLLGVPIGPPGHSRPSGLSPKTAPVSVAVQHMGCDAVEDRRLSGGDIGQSHLLGELGDVARGVQRLEDAVDLGEQRPRPFQGHETHITSNRMPVGRCP